MFDGHEKEVTERRYIIGIFTAKLIDTKSKTSQDSGNYGIPASVRVNEMDSSHPDSWRDPDGVPAHFIRPISLEEDHSQPGTIQVGLDNPHTLRTGNRTMFKLHRLVHMVAHAHGITIFTDGMLEKVGVKLPSGTTFDEYITYKPSRLRRESIELYLREDDKSRSKQCDMDHRLGRDRRYLHGLLYSQPISHRMNTCFSYVRRGAGHWCFGLHLAIYINGVESPTTIDNTYVPTVVGNEVLYNGEQIDETDPFQLLDPNRHAFLRDITGF